MDYFIKEMSKNYAMEILSWTYREPYTIYSGERSDESIEELLDGSYFVALDENNKVIGFYCFGSTAQVPAGDQYQVYNDISFIDIGLGMRPDLCGKGKGGGFFLKGLEFAQKKFQTKKFRLTVALFNKRAIKLYERMGFIKTTSFERKSLDKSIAFLVMEMKDEL